MNLTKNILLLSNNKDELSLVQNYLNSSFSVDLQFSETSSEVEANKKISFQKFDLIIADQATSELSPLSFIRNTQGSDFNKDTPVILLKDESLADIGIDLKNLLKVDRPISYPALVELVAEQLDLKNDDSFKVSSIYSDLITSTSQFLSKVFTSSAEQLSSVPKHMGEELKGDTFVHFDVLINNNIHRSFLISYSKMNISALVDMLHRTDKHQMDGVVAKAALNIIYRELLKTFKSGGVKIQKKSIVCQARSPEIFDQILNKKGVFTPLKTQHGIVGIYAL